MNLFKLLHRKPLLSLVNDEIYETSRRLLEAESGVEHFASLVEMYRKRLSRLDRRRTQTPKENL